MRPRIIHPSRIGYGLLDRTEGTIDPVLKTPIGAKEWTEVPGRPLRGQVAYSRQSERTPGRDNRDYPESDGYVIFEKGHLESRGVAPVVGDRILTIDGSTVDADVVQVQDGTVYSQPWWTFVFFKATQDAGL